jgi:Alginate lyase
MLIQTQAINRRQFGLGLTAAFAQTITPRLLASPAKSSGYALVASVDRKRILRAAMQYLPVAPQTITTFPSDRNPGGLHDFFSEADYFWPNPANPDGPYIELDGKSNPANFQGHRKALIALSVQMPALTAAWRLTGKRIYGEHAAAHLRAWFVDASTRMNANLEFAQGVRNKSTGRSYGIIDTLHLVEVARAASLVEGEFLASGERDALHAWFREFIHWLQTSAKGMAEAAATNNHAVCWALQVAEFARLVQDEATREAIRLRYKTILLAQMATDGSFPRELNRTKPYSYSIFNLDAMATLCESLRAPAENLFQFTTDDGRGTCKGADFLFPYLADKQRWPYAKDVEHFESLPVRAPSLLFCGLACARPDFLTLWKRLNPDPVDPEIIRNYPIRQPLLWL